MIEPGQLRRCTISAERGPFIILENFYANVEEEAWWILTPEGRKWMLTLQIEDFTEVIDEAR